MIIHNKNLKNLNTFMVPAEARYFAVVENIDSLKKILETKEWKTSQKHLVLGGGSNMLFVNDYDGFILKNEIQGMDILDEDDEHVLVRVGAGEQWHDFVMWSVAHNFWGAENLALIPGTVGAAPVQNIGAYGIEVASLIDRVEAFDFQENALRELSKDECDFSYRQSTFKKNPERYFITSVVFRLQKQGTPVTHYGRVQTLLQEKGIAQPSSKDIAELITEIRKSKLPDKGSVGTAGSFFKNPVIEKEQLLSLQKKFPEISYFALENDLVKIPAGWLLDELGYKGFQKGNVGNYEHHALVLTHNGKGTGQEVYEHAQDIMQRVKEVFGIQLEPEVVIVKSDEIDE